MTPSDDVSLMSVSSMPPSRLLLLRVPQGVVTGKSPLENLSEHLANPTVANGFAAATKYAPQ